MNTAEAVILGVNYFFISYFTILGSYAQDIPPGPVYNARKRAPTKEAGVVITLLFGLFWPVLVLRIFTWLLNGLAFLGRGVRDLVRGIEKLPKARVVK